MPLVADMLPGDGTPTNIIVVTYNGIDGCVNPVQLAENASLCPQPAGSKADGSGYIRIFDGNCGLVHTVDYPVRATVTPAIAELDGNPDALEIVTLKNDSGVVAFRWDGEAFVKWWEGTGPSIADKQTWTGLSIHNLDEDDEPEVLAGFPLQQGIRTYRGWTGTGAGAVVATGITFNGMLPVVGDLDADGKADLFTNAGGGVSRLSWQESWQAQAGRAETYASHFALGDFNLDGKTDVLTVNADASPGGEISILNASGGFMLGTTTGDRGGHPAIGDFDGDDRAEAAIPGATHLHLLDLECDTDCTKSSEAWSQPSQDMSSGQTAAAAFDFDDDGADEVVYADECFLRIYDGKSGEVLQSVWRHHGTYYDGPAVANVDDDPSAEIIVGMDAGDVVCPVGGTAGVPYVDPLHKGLRCSENSDCSTGTCDAGFCRCNDNTQCPADYGCYAAPTGTAGTGNTCRAVNPNSAAPRVGGFRVINDAAGCWSTSRRIWNQHAYSITNVRDDGTIPKMSEWVQNGTTRGLNNYRHGGLQK